MRKREIYRQAVRQRLKEEINRKTDLTGNRK